MDGTTQTPAPAEEEAAVLATIARYREALRLNDGPGLMACFTPSARVVHVAMADGTASSSSLEELVALVASLHSQHGGAVETHAAPRLSVAMPVAGVVVDFELRMGATILNGTNVFALARLDDGWRIVSKVYSV